MQETKSDTNNILSRWNHHPSGDECLFTQLNKKKATSNFTGKPTILAGALVLGIIILKE